MSVNRQTIDPAVKDELLRYPMPELLRRLFPGRTFRRRGVMPSPFREDRHPSFSCFVGRGGVSKAKDYSTGESFDNISVYRRACPGLDYVGAVDGLSWMLLGRSAFVEGGVRSGRSGPAQYHGFPRPVGEGALKVTEVLPLLDPSVPSYLRDYWRGRGISDINIGGMCVYARYVNSNRRGRVMMDSVTGLPLLDDSGREMRDEGTGEAIGLYNDIGGMVFRSPARDGRAGFKGASSSFISVLLADGSRPSVPVVFRGVGDCIIHWARPSGDGSVLSVGPGQAFCGLAPVVVHDAVRFLAPWVGREVDARDVDCICAVLTAMGAPRCGRAAVVEGMFDALSLTELQGRAGRGFVPGVDLVVLNSVTNLKWAVPFLAGEAEVRCYLDNDIRSGAGGKASDELRKSLTLFCEGRAGRPLFTDASSLFYPHKDLNDALVADGGKETARVEGGQHKGKFKLKSSRL